MSRFEELGQVRGKMCCCNEFLLGESVLDFLRGRSDLALVDLRREAERVKSLRKVLLARVHIDEHERLRVAPQAGLEDVG